MLRITPFKALYPRDALGNPAMRAALLAHTGSDFLRACRVLNGTSELGFTFIRVVIPAMQQTIELLVKSIAYMSVPDFEPRTYGHRILDLIDAHAGTVPIFAKCAGSPPTRELFAQLTDGYLAVRYGEAHLTMDKETWKTFNSVADELVATASPESNGYKAGTV